MITFDNITRAKAFEKHRERQAGALSLRIYQ